MEVTPVSPADQRRCEVTSWRYRLGLTILSLLPSLWCFLTATSRIFCCILALPLFAGVILIVDMCGLFALCHQLYKGVTSWWGAVGWVYRMGWHPVPQPTPTPGMDLEGMRDRIVQAWIAYNAVQMQGLPQVPGTVQPDPAQQNPAQQYPVKQRTTQRQSTAKGPPQRRPAQEDPIPSGSAPPIPAQQGVRREHLASDPKDKSS